MFGRQAKAVYRVDTKAFHSIQPCQGSSRGTSGTIVSAWSSFQGRDKTISSARTTFHVVVFVVVVFVNVVVVVIINVSCRCRCYFAAAAASSAIPKQHAVSVSVSVEVCVFLFLFMCLSSFETHSLLVVQ